MVFSSVIFLFMFLPVTIAGYYLCGLAGKKIKNIFLLLMSLAFYSWGDVRSLPILAASILFNYIMALLIGKNENNKKAAKALMITSLVGNVGLLCAFKYLTFVLNNLNMLLGINITPPQWAIPLGVSFFTFSAISYVLDVYFKSSQAEANLLNVALYITFFPKMISGPIMKYNDFSVQMENRSHSLEKFSGGVKRFIIGLGKKVIISDIVGILADRTFNGELGKTSAAVLWFSVIAYMIQLYYDFSGYSDMAIGLGKMFGFDIDENFDYPYTSKSVVEYWARWHITLGTWVKHYIYTPVFRAISKKKSKRTGKKYSIKVCDYCALLVSWLIIGPWHGAGYKFIVYGLYYFFFILLERMNDSRKKKRAKAGDPVKTNFFTKNILPHIYMLFVLIFGQMLFRANSLTDAFVYLKGMFALNGNALLNSGDAFLIKQYIVVVAVGVIFSLPIIGKIRELCIKNRLTNVLYFSAEAAVLLFMAVLAISSSVITSYNPFIYFNF